MPVSSQALYEYGFIQYKAQTIHNVNPETLIQWLHSDAIRGNAIAAANELAQRTDESKVALLEKALVSPDWQQRQLSADLLRMNKEYKPSERLIEVTIEALQDDNFPTNQQSYVVFLFNAFQSTRYLLDHPMTGTDQLEEAIGSDDAQQKFLAAYILAATNRGMNRRALAEILLPHLKHNEREGDACMAVHALYRLGSDIFPLLQPLAASDDTQESAAVRFLLDYLQHPPESEVDRLNRLQIPQLSPLHPDPVQERVNQMLLWKE